MRSETRASYVCARSRGESLRWKKKAAEPLDPPRVPAAALQNAITQVGLTGANAVRARAMTRMESAHAHARTLADD